MPGRHNPRIQRLYKSSFAAAIMGALLALGGCSGFFFKETTTGGGGGTSATNYVFVANAGSSTVTGIGISTAGAMATLSGSPITLSDVPTALTVARGNGFLWVGTVSQIFGFSIASDGTIAALNSGNALVNANCADMQTTPDGKWLMVLDGTGTQIALFATNSDGTLSASSGAGFQPSGTPVPRALRINPAGTVVAAALGTAGEVLLNFDTTKGTFSNFFQSPPPDLTSDNGIAWDSTGTYLYIVRSGNNAGLVVTTVGSNLGLTPTTSTVYPTGAQPYSVVLDNTNSYVYVANRTDSTITGYSIGANAALTAISGSPFSSGAAVTQLGADSTGKWLLAAAYSGAPDLTLYGFDSNNAGRIYSVSSIGTGTNASELALSH